MFKFLKEKLKNTVSGISEKIEKEAEEAEEEVQVEEKPEEQKTEPQPEEKKEDIPPEEDEVEKELELEEKEEVKKEEAPVEEKKEEPEEKKGFLGKIKGLFKHKEEHLSEEDQQKLKDQLEGKPPAPKEEEKKEEPEGIKVAPTPKEMSPPPTPKEDKKEEKGFFEKIKEKITHKDHEEEGFEEHKLEEKKEEEKKPEVVKKVASINVKEKVENGKTPSIQELMERKGGYDKKLKPPAPKEESPAEEKKEEPSVQDIAFGRSKPVTQKSDSAQEKKEEPSIQDIAAGKTAVPEIEKFKKEEPELKKKTIETEETSSEEPKEEKKGFLAKIKEKIVTKKISEKQFDEIFWDLEVALLENNIAVEVIEKIKLDLKTNLVDKPIPRGKVTDTVLSSLKDSLSGLFDVPELNIFERMEKKKPLVICFLGVNGSGKTTTIAKIASLIQKYDFSCVMAAADTFRAAAIDQLEQHAKALNIKMIKHDYGSDPAAVAFDAVKYAKAKEINAVLIDTAGRLHSNTNLMDEMKKIIKVANPDLKLFIGESITGNDCVEQAKKFDELVGIDGIILSKADVDEKGGAAISVSYVTKKPILYLGVGQRYEDIEEFDAEKLLSSLGL